MYFFLTSYKFPNFVYCSNSFYFITFSIKYLKKILSAYNKKLYERTLYPYFLPYLKTFSHSYICNKKDFYNIVFSFLGVFRRDIS